MLTIFILAIIIIASLFFVLFGIKFLLRDKIEIISIVKRIESSGEENYIYTGTVLDSAFKKTIIFYMKDNKYKIGDIVYL